MEAKQKQSTTSNFLQLAWQNTKAIEAVDVLMNVFHLGSPTFLIKEEKNDANNGLALWLQPAMNLIKNEYHKMFSRIEVRSSPGSSQIYLTLNVAPWLIDSSCVKKFEKLSHQMFLNLILNWIDQEVTIVCECLAEGLAIAALLQDFFLDKTTAEQIAPLWQAMVDDILAENNNLVTLCRHSQKYLKPERLFKFLPLTSHFYHRLAK